MWNCVWLIIKKKGTILTFGLWLLNAAHHPGRTRKNENDFLSIISSFNWRLKPNRSFFSLSVLRLIFHLQLCAVYLLFWSFHFGRSQLRKSESKKTYRSWNLLLASSHIHELRWNWTTTTDWSTKQLLQTRTKFILDNVVWFKWAGPHHVHDFRFSSARKVDTLGLDIGVA